MAKIDFVPEIDFEPELDFEPEQIDFQPEEPTLPQRELTATERLKKQVPFAAIRRRIGAPELERGERTVIGSIFERPAAAVRAGIRGLAPGGETPAQAFTRAAVTPEEEETFREQLGRGFGRAPAFLRRLPIGTIPGLTAEKVVENFGALSDIATSPADLLLLMGTLRPKPKVRPFLKEPTLETIRKRQIIEAADFRAAELSKQIRETIPNSPEMVGNINISKFPPAARNVLKKLADEHPNVVTTEKFTDLQLLNLSNEIKRTGNLNFVEQIFKTPKGQFAAEIKAVRDSTADTVLNMGDDINRAFLDIRRLSEITKVPGRALRQFRKPVEQQAAAVEVLNNKIRATADPAQRSKLFEMKQIVGGREFNPTMWDKVVEWATAIKLSSPKTPLRAIVGNTFNKIIKFPERAATGLVDRAASVITGRSRERFAREALADVVGSTRAVKSSAKRALQSLVDESVAFKEVTRAGEVVRGRGAIGGRLGKFVRLPFRAVAAPDILVRNIDIGGETASLATRQALREGLKGVPLSTRIAQLISSPTDDIVRQAEANAAKTVFQEPLFGFMKRLNGLREYPVVRLIIPFFKTPVNLFKTFLRKTPGTLLLPSSRQALRQIAKPGGGAGSEVIGQALVGSTIMSALIAYAFDGNITGRGPKNKAERDALFREGWQPNSIKIGDRYVSYLGLEPMADFLQFAAASVENRDAPSEERARKIVFDLMKNFANQPFLTGVNDLFSAFENENQLQRFLNNFVSGNIVPTGVRGITRAISPEVKKPVGVVETIVSRLPGFEKGVLPRRNAFGEPIQIPGTPLERFVSPVRVTREFITPVDAELKRLGLTVSFPGTRISNLKLTPEEFDELLRNSGPAIKRALGNLIALPSYQKLSTIEKEKIIKKIERDIREKFANEILVRKVIQGIEEKGLDFVVNLRKEKKLTEKVKEISQIALRRKGLI